MAKLLLSFFVLHLLQLEASLAEVHAPTILNVYGFTDKLKDEADVDGADQGADKVDLWLSEGFGESLREICQRLPIMTAL